MKVNLTVEFCADGYYTEEEELDCLKVMIEDLDSSGVSIKVLKMEKEENAGTDNV